MKNCLTALISVSMITSFKIQLKTFTHKISEYFTDKCRLKKSSFIHSKRMQIANLNKNVLRTQNISNLPLKSITICLKIAQKFRENVREDFSSFQWNVNWFVREIM